MDAITKKAIENYFKNVSSEMEVDIVKNDNDSHVKIYTSLNEILSDYDDNGEVTMYFPI